jgi:hypothetical protein
MSSSYHISFNSSPICSKIFFTLHMCLLYTLDWSNLRTLSYFPFLDDISYSTTKLSNSNAIFNNAHLGSFQLAHCQSFIIIYSFDLNAWGSVQKTILRLTHRINRIHLHCNHSCYHEKSRELCASQTHPLCGQFECGLTIIVVAQSAKY